MARRPRFSREKVERSQNSETGLLDLDFDDLMEQQPKGKKGTVVLVGINVVTLITASWYIGAKAQKLDETIVQVEEFRKTQNLQDIQITILQQNYEHIKESLDEIKIMLRKSPGPGQS